MHREEIDPEPRARPLLADLLGQGDQARVVILMRDEKDAIGSELEGQLRLLQAEAGFDMVDDRDDAASWTFHVEDWSRALKLQFKCMGGSGKRKD
ncbi:hypothetical protein OCUBac02_52860 (plasmid) [Bosea sp. ANAM02]|nr:hypothetical protein OCUBac02_52860 [Bosea sp. ANAM02]